VLLATALCETFLLRMLKTVEQAENQLRVVVPIEEEVTQRTCCFSCLHYKGIHFILITEITAVNSEDNKKHTETYILRKNMQSFLILRQILKLLLN
jgi:hypothetical protein